MLDCDDDRITITCSACGQVLRWYGRGDVTVEPCPNCIGELTRELDEAGDLLDRLCDHVDALDHTDAVDRVINEWRRHD